MPPFTPETAAQKARSAEDGWNSCNPERVSLAYTTDSEPIDSLGEQLKLPAFLEPRRKDIENVLPPLEIPA